LSSLIFFESHDSFCSKIFTIPSAKDRGLSSIKTPVSLLKNERVALVVVAITGSPDKKYSNILVGG